MTVSTDGTVAPADVFVQMRLSAILYAAGNSAGAAGGSVYNGLDLTPVAVENVSVTIVIREGVTTNGLTVTLETFADGYLEKLVDNVPYFEEVIAGEFSVGSKVRTVTSVVTGVFLIGEVNLIFLPEQVRVLHQRIPKLEYLFPFFLFLLYNFLQVLLM